jgi:hypothetical protein
MIEGGVVSNRLRALFLLGWSFAVSLLKRLTRSEPGLVAFHRNYGADHLAPLGPEARAGYDRFEGCIACGRCDVGEADRMIAARGAYPGLMQLVLASTRSIPDFDAAARAFAHTPDALLEAKAKRCPAHIPFAELAALVRTTASLPAGTEDLLTRREGRGRTPAALPAAS